MKASELRIGNLVTDEWAPKGVWPVVKFTDKKVWYGTFNCRLESARPIPLTEEWLLKFGFTPSNHNNASYKAFDFGIYRIYLSKPKFEFWVLDTDYEEVAYCKLRDLSYVHQLQNLHFTLTDEELTIC